MSSETKTVRAIDKLASATLTLLLCTIGVYIIIEIVKDMIIPLIIILLIVTVWRAVSLWRRVRSSEW